MIKKDIRPTNNKKQKHGLWINYYFNGDLLYKGHWVNGIRHGYWMDNWILRKQNITFHIK